MRIIWFLLGLFLSLETFGYQVDLPSATANIKSVNSISSSSADSFYQTLAKIFTTYIWMFTGVVAFILVLTAGYYLVTSQGNAEDLKKANKMLVWWLVGIFVSLLAYVFVKVLINLF